MRKIAITASFGLAFLLVVVTTTGADQPSKVGIKLTSSKHRANPRPWCAQTFTVPMDHRAAGAIYAGTKDVSLHELRVLGYIEMCQRKVRHIRAVRAYNAAAAKAWDLRRNPPLAYGNWAIPAAIVMCESGGANLPPNSAGASGYYQIIPSTWQSYGGGQYASEAYLAGKSGQDDIAGRIWAGGSGAGQWVCKA